jgi:hypothetical protein
MSNVNLKTKKESNIAFDPLFFMRDQAFDLTLVSHRMLYLIPL